MNKLEIVNKINDFNKEYQFEIFKIIKKNNIKYTENNNGIFINMNDIDCLDEIIQYINFIDDNKKEILKFEELKEINRKKLLKNGINGINEINDND